MRIYVPATLRMLRRLVADDVLDPLGGTAFALTPALREAYAAGDTDELEYVAMREAARASLRLLSIELVGDQPAWPRRVVVAVDTDAALPRPDLDDAAVRVTGSIPAAAVVDSADLGDPDAEFVLGEAEDFELAWYDPSELPFLLELLDL